VALKRARGGAAIERRDFFKLMAVAATSAAAHAQPAGSAPPEQSGFDVYAQDYAHFCATPADQRVFYALEDGKIARQKLDEAAWKPTAWGDSPKLPVPGGSWDGVPMASPIPDLAGEGPYKPNWESLLQYEAPEWYRDAKFGIWAHWSPQCVPEAGDWYARKMYIPGSPDNRYQIEHYGPPSRFGYKDLCAQWTLLNWRPDEMIARYKKAGARLFLTLANHHDGFDTWDSKHQPWNAANIGPHRDVIGTWAEAARKQGLRIGVTIHQARNWWWFQTSHGAAASGPLAGVPYDGRMTQADGQRQWWQGYDPQRLYGPKHPPNALPDISYVKNFYDRTRDLIDLHDPDLLYFDNALFPLGWGGMNAGAYFYNHNLKTHGGRMEGAINIKEVPERFAKSVIADYERGLTGEIMRWPWQSETCLGDWHYKRALFDQPGEYGGYLHPREVIHWLIDTVSKNGTFVLNVPGRPDGTIDSKEEAVLDAVTAWMASNSEAIHETRPWKIYGEGPDMVKSGSFQGLSISKLGEKDVRFTRNKTGNVIYAIVLGWPAGDVAIGSLGTSNATRPGKIARVELLGTGEHVHWKQAPEALRVTLPKRYHPPVDFAASLKVTLA
jgi:alpha-L-fucosidase